MLEGRSAWTVPMLFAVGLLSVAVLLEWLPEDCEGKRAEEAQYRVEVEAAALDFEVRNELEDLMVQSMMDEERIAAFHGALLEADLFVVNDKQVLATARAEGKATASFHLIEHRGAPALPVYTSRERLPEDPDLEAGVLPFSTILTAMDPPAPILLNPGSELPRPIYLEELAALRRQLTQ